MGGPWRPRSRPRQRGLNTRRPRRPVSLDGVTIVGWTKHSFIDFPGTVATVLFFSGCNLACPWCHNPGVVRGIHPAVSPGDILAYIDKRRDVIEGVVLTGGEPTAQAGLPAFADELRRRKIAVKLDTNGLLPDSIERCAPDYLALDIKTYPSRYGELGCRFHDADLRLSRSIAMVKNMGASAEIRITVAPGFIDEQVITSLIPLLAGVGKVFLQPLKNNVELLDPAFARKPIVPIEQIREYRDILAPVVGECVIRGDSP
jgi:pyruvate formate lyase activating enzyme